MSDHEPSPQTPHRAWKTIGIVLGVILAIAGLAVVGFVIFFVIAINSYGSNK